MKLIPARFVPPIAVAVFAVFAGVAVVSINGQPRQPTGIVRTGCPASTAALIVVPITGVDLRAPLACLVLDPASVTLDNSTTPPTARFKPSTAPVINFQDDDPACNAWNGPTGTLGAIPNPATSLSITINGLTQKTGLDYTLNAGGVVTWIGQPVLASDTLRCSYRFGGN